MKTILHIALLSLFSVQNTLAFPAQHQLQAQALDSAAQLDAAAEAFEHAPTEGLSPEFHSSNDSRWTQKLASRLHTKGLKRFEKRLEKELAQPTLSEAEKAQVRLESQAQSQAAITQIVETAKQTRSPIQLVKTLKQNLREARAELARARAQENASAQNPSKTKTAQSLQAADRKPAQIVISINIRNLLKAIAILMVAIMLVMLVYGFVALVTTVFLPVLVVAVVITIVI
jgi:hypothetical protein